MTILEKILFAGERLYFMVLITFTEFGLCVLISFCSHEYIYQIWYGIVTGSC